MLGFYKTEVKPLSDKLTEMLNGNKEKKTITVYEPMYGPNNTIVYVPIKKKESYKALGLSLRGRNG